MPTSALGWRFRRGASGRKLHAPEVARAVPSSSEAPMKRRCFPRSRAARRRPMASPSPNSAAGFVSGLAPASGFRCHRSAASTGSRTQLRGSQLAIVVPSQLQGRIERRRTPAFCASRAISAARCAFGPGRRYDIHMRTSSPSCSRCETPRCGFAAREEGRSAARRSCGRRRRAQEAARR